ncbi:MAG: cellulase family glycosylhydrolase, partial [Dongiaceae bacterium]
MISLLVLLTAAAGDLTFAVMRRRWNMNAVRIPVSVATWQCDGQAYLDRVAALVRRANDADLVAILAACELARCGATNATDLPAASTIAFWRVWAAFFRDNPRLVFSVFEEPSARNVPGATAGRRTAADWQRAVGIQEIVDAIRAAGAPQIVSLPAFHDELGFQMFEPAHRPRDPNVIYEIHPLFDFPHTQFAWDAAFGRLARDVPVYAGVWGLTLTENRPGCTNLPAEPSRVIDILFNGLSLFDLRLVSWTAASFEPGSLISDAADFSPTTLDSPWTCGVRLNPQPGMGEGLILWLTGDPTGFGVLRALAIGNAAGGPAGPVAPGEIIAIYAEQLGPENPALASFDASGRLPVSLGDTQIYFDGVAAPIFFSGAFQINVQVPHFVAGARTTTIQAV